MNSHTRRPGGTLWIASVVGVGVLLCGCSSQADGGADTSGSGGDFSGGSSGTGFSGAETVESANSRDATLNGSDACGSEADVAIEVGRRLASATYAASALEAHLRPDPAMLRRSEFQSYFAPSSLDAPGVYGRFSAAGSLVDLELAAVRPAQAKPPATSLVVIVDESSSMREELPLSAVLLDTMLGTGGLGSADGDLLSVIEWRDRAETLVEAESPSSSDALGASARLRDRAEAQLAGSPTVALLDEAVQSAITKSGATPVHVVLVSDGGFPIDDASRATFDAWAGRAEVSFVEVHVLSGDELPFRGQLHDAFDAGVQLYVGATPEQVPAFVPKLFGARFGELFRVQPATATGHVLAMGVTFPASASAVGPETDVPTRWAGDGGTVFMRPEVAFCGGPVSSVPVKVKVGTDDERLASLPDFGLIPATPTDLSSARTARMMMVDRVVGMLGQCPLDAAKLGALRDELTSLALADALTGAELLEHQSAIAEMKAWLTAAETACP